MSFQRILVPTDFSEHSSAAAECASELAQRLNAELHVLHVLALHASATPEFGMGLVMPSQSHESRTAAEKLLASVLQPESAAGATVIRAVAEGTPAEAILQYAKDHAIDLIVLSTHGRSGLAHALLGSVAESVVRQAHCPVMTVRPQA